MAGFKNNPPVTVTVRPNGTYVVEKALARTPQGVTVRRSPLAAAITTTLGEFAGVAAAVKAVAPALGKYGVVAAIGFGVLNAIASNKPAPHFQLRRVRVRRIPAGGVKP
jgi:hypothetical protein